MSDTLKQGKPFLQQIKRISFASVDEWFGHKFLHRDIGELLVYVSVLCYALVFCFFTIRKYASFHAYAWDLGIFNQSFWNTLHGGGLFTSTVEQFICPSGSFFGTHFSPVLFLVLPAYSLAPSPETLLVVQSLVLALAAVPLYFFAKNTFNNQVVAVVFALIYLLYPPLQGINWFDFHTQAFLPLFFFSTFYFLSKEKWRLYFTFIFLSLTVAENVPVTVIFIGGYCFWRFRKRIVDSLKTRAFADPRLLAPILTIGFALAWIFMASWIRQTYFPFDPDFTQLYKAVDHWSVLGIQDDPMKLPMYIVMAPGRAFEALTYDYAVKLLYIILLFGPLLFLSFRSWITAVSLAWLVPALFSNYFPYYSIGAHYPAYPLVFIFLGAVEGLKNSVKPTGLLTLAAVTKRLLLVGVIVTLLISPLSPVMADLENRFPYFSDYHPPSMTRHDELLHTIVECVPDNASILTQNRIFPHISSRTEAYVYPLDWMVIRYNGTQLQDYIEGLFAKSEYVMADSLSDQYTTSLIVSRVHRLGDFGLYVYGDGICLFRRGYSDEALILNP